MTQPSELDDETLYNYLLGMQEDERTDYISQLGDDDRQRVNSLLMYGYTGDEAAEVEEQTEEAYPGYENRDQPAEGDHAGWAQEEEAEQDEDEDEDGAGELAEDADTGWKAPSVSDDVPPDNEQMFARELDDILDEGDPLGRDEQDDESEGSEDETDQDERTVADDDLDIRSENEESEDEQEEEDVDTDLDIRPEIDFAAAERENKVAVAAIVARTATNRTTTFMQLPGGEFLFGSGHGIDIVATAAGGSGTIRFSRNRLSANDFVVENESGDVDYEELQDAIRSICGALDEYDYGDDNRVRVK
jgi:hypothetical protein